MTAARKHPLDKVRVGEGRPGSWFVWQSGYWGTQVAEGPFDTKEAADRAAVTVRRAIRTKGRTPIKRNATTIVVVGGGGHHKNPRELDVFDRHQLAIARKTLRMPDAMLGVMGGPTKAEARAIIRRLTGKNPSQRTLKLHRLRSRVVARINPPRDKRGRFMKRRR